MNLPRLNTHPILDDFFQAHITNDGQVICNDDIAHQHNEKYAKSDCCRKDVYYVDGIPFCQECHSLCDSY